MLLLPRPIVPKKNFACRLPETPTATANDEKGKGPSVPKCQYPQRWVLEDPHSFEESGPWQYYKRARFGPSEIGVMGVTVKLPSVCLVRSLDPIRGSRAQPLLVALRAKDGIEEAILIDRKKTQVLPVALTQLVASRCFI